MVRVEVIKKFKLGRFDELKNIERRRTEEKGKLFVGDIFECSEELAEYLMGANENGDVVVKVIEIIPQEKEVKKIENVDEAIERIKDSAKEEVKTKSKKKKKTSA